MQESLGVLLWHHRSHSHIWCICWTLTCVCVSDGCTRGRTRSSGGVKKTSWQSYNACKTSPPRSPIHIYVFVSLQHFEFFGEGETIVFHITAVLRLSWSQLATSWGFLCFFCTQVRLSVSRVMTCNNFICVNVFGGLSPLSTCRVSGSFSHLCTFSMSTPVFQSWEVVDFLDFKLFRPSAVKRRKASVSAVTEVNRGFLSSHWRSHRACCQSFIIWGSHLGSRL